MTTPYLTRDIEADEGLRSVAYPDPLTHGEPWTIGVGHTGKNVHQGLVWSQSQCIDQLMTDIGTVQRALDGSLKWWRNLNDARQDVMVNMGFNLGVAKLMTFSTFLGLVQRGEYALAAHDMLQTAWAKQVGHRAVRLSEQMTSGVRVAS